MKAHASQPDIFTTLVYQGTAILATVPACAAIGVLEYPGPPAS